jgi:hypothetical protein
MTELAFYMQRNPRMCTLDGAKDVTSARFLERSRSRTIEAHCATRRQCLLENLEAK